MIIKRINFSSFDLDRNEVARFNFELVPKHSSGEYQLSHTKFLSFVSTCVPWQEASSCTMTPSVLAVQNEPGACSGSKTPSVYRP